MPLILMASEDEESGINVADVSQTMSVVENLSLPKRFEGESHFSLV